MRTAKRPASRTDVVRAMAAIDARIKKLVWLLGDPDEGIAADALGAIKRIGEPALGPLSQAILQPRSEIHQISAIFAVRFMRPRDSMAVQLALTVVKQSAKNQRIAVLANTVLYSLAFDDVEYAFMDARRQMVGLDDAAKDTLEAIPDWRDKLTKERLTELEAIERQVAKMKGSAKRPARKRRSQDSGSVGLADRDGP